MRIPSSVFPFLALTCSETLVSVGARPNQTSASAFVSAFGTTASTASTTTCIVPSINSNARNLSTSLSGASSSVSGGGEMTVDAQYPGTAVERMMSVRARVAQQATENAFTGVWDDVRRKILWAGGLKDLPDARPGQGYTGHSFNDFNHVDLTCMLDQVSDNENDGQVKGIAIGNRLGNGIRLASLPELGPGGSWSTCAMGCHKEPPSDVAHVQFRSRIAFKLVWVPPTFDSFVLVDDDGKLLAHGKDLEGVLPPLRERQMNYRIVARSKYAKEADRLGSNEAAE